MQAIVLLEGLDRSNPADLLELYGTGPRPSEDRRLAESLPTMTGTRGEALPRRLETGMSVEREA